MDVAVGQRVDNISTHALTEGDPAESKHVPV